MSYTLFEDRVRKARKPHRCIWCPELIAKGETYHDERSVYDGNIQRHRWHPECQTAAHKFFRESCGEDFMAHSCKRGTCEER